MDWSIDECTDLLMDRWIYGCVYGLIDVCMDLLMYVCFYWCMYGFIMDGLIS